MAGIAGTLDLDNFQDPQRLEEVRKVLAPDKDNAASYTEFNMS